MKELTLWIPVALSVIGLLFMLYKFLWVKKQDSGNEKMQGISKSIAEGAMAFLSAEYRLLLIFVIVASLALFGISRIVETTSWLIVPAFITGAIFSGLAGNIGMKVATAANVRTTQAARTSLPKALNVSFSGGTVMGLGVAGLAVLGLTLFFILFSSHFIVGERSFSEEMVFALEALAGFSLGAESIALFARVGGGIYTKAADVGADLVGKVEAGIPEDDPRHPATIADNVGDNVGDVAGMGADLFGSFVSTVIGTVVLGREIIVQDAFGGLSPVILPMVIAGVGTLFSILGTYFVSIKNEKGNVQKALNVGNWIAIILTAIASYFIITQMLPDKMVLRGHEFTSSGVFGAVIVGLVVGTLMSIITEYYT